MSIALKVAIILLKRGEPLPVDLQARLLAEGICVTSLEKRYSK